MRKQLCVVVGTGSIGQRHLRVLQASGAVDVVALPIRAQHRQEFQTLGTQVVDDWNQVVAQGITHAIIATDTRRHEIDIQAAFDAKCHVLVEKPMAVDAMVAFGSWQLAKQLKKSLWVGCCLRFQQALNIFREQLPYIGKVHFVRIECLSYLPDWRPDRPYQDSYSARFAEGGVLRDLIHEIDYATWLFGRAQAVTAKVRATQRLGIAAEDAADLIWETDSGIVVSITLDYLSRPSRRCMYACGEFGTLEWDGIAGQVTLTLVGGLPCQTVSAQTRDEMYLAQDLAFMESASNKQTHDSHLATGAEGVCALAICDAARLASERKCETKVDCPAGL